MNRHRIRIWLDPEDLEEMTEFFPEDHRDAERIVQVLKQHNSLVQQDPTIKPVRWNWHERQAKTLDPWTEVEGG